MLQRSSFVLGKGGCATVYLGRITYSDAASSAAADGRIECPPCEECLVAVKQRFRLLRSSPEKNEWQAEAEHELLASIPPHPNVMPICAAFLADECSHYAMPLMDSDMGFEMRSHKLRVSEPQAVLLIQDLLRAVEHVHRHGIAHRDIKPSNALLLRDEMHPLGVRVVLGDFGVAHRTDPKRASFATNACGTQRYQPPEQLSSHLRREDAATCDMWACGCIFYEVLTGGRPPFVGDSAIEVLSSILTAFGLSLFQYFNSETTVPSNAPFFERQEIRALNADTRALLFGLLDLDAAQRLTAVEALQHPVFNQMGSCSVAGLSIRGYQPPPARELLTFFDINASEGADLDSTAHISECRQRDRSTDWQRRALMTIERSNPIADGRVVTLSSANGTIPVSSWVPSEMNSVSPSPQRRTLCFDSEEE